MLQGKKIKSRQKVDLIFEYVNVLCWKIYETQVMQFQTNKIEVVYKYKTAYYELYVELG